MQTAKPKAQPPAKKKPSSTETAQAIKTAVSVVTTKEQRDFVADAAAFAASLGWEGEGHYVLNDIQVSDAVRFLTKTFHELHVVAWNPGTKQVVQPTAESVCAHLHIDDPDAVEVVTGKLAQVLKDETPKPAS